MPKTQRDRIQMKSDKVEEPIRQCLARFCPRKHKLADEYPSRLSDKIARGGHPDPGLLPKSLEGSLSVAALDAR